MNDGSLHRTILFTHPALELSNGLLRVFDPSTPFVTCFDHKSPILFSIAQIFDPLGWLTPTVIVAKIFLQELWAIRLDWDENLSENLKTRWEHFAEQLPQLSNLSIPRWFGLISESLGVDCTDSQTHLRKRLPQSFIPAFYTISISRA